MPRPVTLFVLLCIFAVRILHAYPATQSTFTSPVSFGFDDGLGVDNSTYANLRRYARFASAAYHPLCMKPAGQELVQHLKYGAIITKGFVAIDRARKEIIVAFRGTFDLLDVIRDVQVRLKPLPQARILSAEARVHAGFLDVYNSIAEQMLDIVQRLVLAMPDYSLVVTGHSMGGALASLASLTLRKKFPKQNLSLYTYGQPRTGNPVYARLVEDTVGLNNIFRSVHTFDGVPTVIPQELGYGHHGMEYWHHKEPPLALHVRKCEGVENATCSASITSTGINVAHAAYYGQTMAFDLTVCLRA